MTAAYTLIPLLPFAAFLILALGGRWCGAAAHRVAIPAVGVSFALSVAALVDVVTHGPIDIALYRLMHSGDLVVDVGLSLDQLTVLLLPLVTGVSGVVYVYAARYMIGDPRYSRFFAMMALFTCAMIVLVMSSNLLVVYIAWEIMGLCSYVLIAHRAERPAACRAATQSFLMNAVADVGLGFGVILTFVAFGTLDIPQILARAGTIGGQTVNLLGWAGGEWPVQTVTLITLCVFVGAMGKSAQAPFHMWLPLAMEAPTPVSALIHAATMVNAGPFLLIRLSPLVVLSPTAMTVIAVVGIVTALFAAVVSLTQSDVKTILAWSTISQLGFMMMACGVGAFGAALFHVLAHGCLKGFLFLSTGNALHDVHAHGRPVAAAGSPGMAVSLGALALACIPPLVIFLGPYERLWTAQHFAWAHAAFWLVGLTAVFVTATSVFRGMSAFFRPAAGAADLRPRVWSPFHLPGVILGTVVAAGALAMCWTWMAQFLTPVLGQAGGDAAASMSTVTSASAVTSAVSWPAWWILAPLLAAVCGWGVAFARHVNPGRGLLGRSAWGRTLYVLFLNKGYADELAAVYVVRPTLRFAGWLWRVVDVNGIDRVVMGMGACTMRMANWLWRCLEMRETGSHLERFPHTADSMERRMRDAAPQLLQHHVLVMVIWLIVATALFYWFAV